MFWLDWKGIEVKQFISGLTIIGLVQIPTNLLSHHAAVRLKPTGGIALRIAFLWALRYFKHAMSMRYLLRNPTPTDFSALEGKIPGLQDRLGVAKQYLERDFKIPVTDDQYVVYHFATRKLESGWAWYCPSIELVGRKENSLLALAETMGVPRSQLSHLPT